MNFDRRFQLLFKGNVVIITVNQGIFLLHLCRKKVLPTQASMKNACKRAQKLK